MLLVFYFFLILKSLILTCVPKHEPPSHLPPHNISVGHPHVPAPSMLYPASDIDWRFNPYMIVYMLECHSPNNFQLCNVDIFINVAKQSTLRKNNKLSTL